MILEIGEQSKICIDTNHVIGVSGIINRDGDAYDFFIFTEHHSLAVRNLQYNKATEDRQKIIDAISIDELH